MAALCSLCLCGFIAGPASFAADNSPVIYNNGVRAYQTNDLAVAAQTFEQATASPDRALQQRALYNLGNTTYRLGEGDARRAEQLWQRAIKSYESALALDPKDEDAKFNQEFVKKKLEELKKQQEQQKQQQQNQQKQDKQDKDKQDQKQQDQQQSPQDQQQQQKQEDSRKGAKPQGEQQKQEEQQAQAEPKPGDNSEKQRAAALLDNLKEDERNWNFFPEVQMKDLKESGQPVKDW